MSNAWTKSWDIIGTSGRNYKVSIREDGVSWDCSCPAHKFQKQSPKVDCQHILQVKLKESVGMGDITVNLTSTNIIKESTGRKFKSI